MNITKAYNFINNDSRVSSSGLIMTIDLQSFVDEGYEAIINLLPDEMSMRAITRKQISKP
jgi:protein tyrosine phosphatase (PTP) superfamily phosphohydrolase (DUF442 family)